MNNSGLFENEIKLHSKVIHHKENNKSYLQYYFTKSSSSFKNIYDNYHAEDRIERILSNLHSDRSLAIWFMDDGSVVKVKRFHKDGSEYFLRPTFHLCTHCFTEDENKKIAEWFNRRYLIDAKLTHETKRGVKYTYLRFNALESEKIYRLIRNYVNQIESMRNKFNFIEQYYFPDNYL